jgi:hypothetical protein
MKNRRSRGRPPVHVEARHITSVAIPQTMMEFVRANDLNLSEIVKNSIEAMMDRDLFQLHELEKKINKMKVELQILQDEYARMLIVYEEQEEIRRSQKVANEYPAYYLRKMVLEGKYYIRSQLDHMNSLEDDQVIREYFDVDKQKRTLSLKEGCSMKDISPRCRLILANVSAIQKEGHIEIPAPKQYLSGKIKEGMSIDHEDILIREIEEKFISEDLLPAYFMKFGPKITDPALAKKVREEYTEFLRKSHIQMIPEGSQESD